MASNIKHPKLNKLIHDALTYHALNIGVSHYNCDIIYMNEPNSLPNCTATMNVNRRYLNAELRIFPSLVKAWKEKGDSYVEQVIAHEVAHILTAHLYELGLVTYKEEGEMTDAWESLTEAIGRMSVKIDELKKH